MIDAMQLTRMVYCEGDNVYCYSQASGKRVVFPVSYDNIKLKEYLDRVRIRCGADATFSIFSIKDKNSTNTKSNLFRSRIYLYIDIDKKIDVEVVKSMNPEPSVIIETKNGWHVLWIGREPILYDDELETHYKFYIANSVIECDEQSAPYKMYRMPTFLGSDNKTVINGQFTGVIYDNYDTFIKQSIPDYYTNKSEGFTPIEVEHFSLEDLLNTIEICAQLKKFTETGGNNYNEWLYGTMYFAFCAAVSGEYTGAKEHYHEACKKYEKYNPNECEKKYERLYRGYKSGALKYVPSCEKLKMEFGEQCGSCIKWKGKYPVRKYMESYFKLPPMFVEESGMLYYTDEKGNIPVLGTTLRPVISIKDIHSGEYYLKLLSGKNQNITIPEMVIPDTISLSKALSAKHVTVYNEKIVKTYIKQCQNTVKTIDGSSKIGYYNGKVIQSNDYDMYPIFFEIEDAMVAQYSERKGDPLAYKECINALIKKYPLFAVVYSAGMLQFFDENPNNLNPIIRIYGRAGSGKSLLLSYVKSIIGNPHLIPSYRNITPLKLVDFAAKTSLLVLDELTFFTTYWEPTVNAIFAISSGSGRISYKQSTKEMFRTTVVSAGERKFLTTSNMNKGLHRRMYEMYVNIKDNLLADMIDGTKIISQNYGFMREIIISINQIKDKVKEQEKYTIEKMINTNTTNHYDTICNMARVITTASIISGIPIEKLIEVSVIDDTMYSDDPELSEDIVDYCVSAIQLIGSVYSESCKKGIKIITRQDIEKLLKSHELDYYPEVEKIVRVVFNWGQYTIRDKKKVFSRSGIIVKENSLPHIYALFEHITNPSDTPSYMYSQIKDEVERRLALLKRADHEVYDLLKLVVARYCEVSGTRHYPDTDDSYKYTNELVEKVFEKKVESTLEYVTPKIRYEDDTYDIAQENE